MPPDDTCRSQTHSRQKTLCQPCPAPLLAHGQSPPGYPRGQCAPHSHRWDSNPRSCRNAGPLSPLKQVAGPASAEERLGGGFSSPRSGVALKCSHSNKWARSLPCSNCPKSRKGIYPTRTEQLLAHGPAAEAAGHLVSHPSGYSVPVHACARVGRVMRQCPRSQSQTRAPRALSRAHPLEIQGLCAQRAPGPTFLAPAATQRTHSRTPTLGHLLASLTSYMSCPWCP